MLKKMLVKIFGDREEREIKRVKPVVEEINRLYADLEKLSDDELREKLNEIKDKLQSEMQDFDGRILDTEKRYQEEMNESKRMDLSNELDNLRKKHEDRREELLRDNMPMVYAIIKDTCRRLKGSKYKVLGEEMEWFMVPYDVQLIGAIALNEGKIAEMATGEGKTLVATMPLFLNSLTGYNCHLVTVNDYLAKRDSEWMKPIFNFHGLTVGVIVSNMDISAKKKAYEKNVTYGTNSEFGFDYLRENLARRSNELVQSDLYYAIIDEVDSVLIDEARTPLIISGRVSEDKNYYRELKPDIRSLISKQKSMVDSLILQLEHRLHEEDEASRNLSAKEKEVIHDSEIGVLLLKIYRASPKDKRYLKLMEQSRLQKEVQRYEGYYIKDKKMSEIDSELYYYIEEKNNSVNLTEKGTEFLSSRSKNLFEIKSIEQMQDEYFREMGPIEEEEKKEINALTKKIDDKKNQIDAATKKSEKEKLEAILALDEEYHQKRAEIEKKYEPQKAPIEKKRQDFIEQNEKLHNIDKLLTAYILYEKDVDYVVQDNMVMLVDQFTGRMMPGRRLSDGLHQAIEAKENCVIKEATQTVASISLQNYFRMYKKLAGMTGTAMTEEAEFLEIYKLPVMKIPTNEPITRIDHQDLIFLNKEAKYEAVIREIKYWHSLNKPVLVGTVSVDVSEYIGSLLDKENIKHSILNAKHHEREAEIIKDAGLPGAVTIATNMAGRGTDIKLGEGVIEQSRDKYLGLSKSITESHPFGLPIDGLHVIGTERHESRRIDSQLRGRAGRQGDPGTSRFYLSLEDDLMRLYASDKIANLLAMASSDNSQAISHPLMTRAIEQAQKRIEGVHFDSRKRLVEFDEVMDQQRQIVYRYRSNVLKGYDQKHEILQMIEETICRKVDQYTSEGKFFSDWDIESLLSYLNGKLRLSCRESDIASGTKKELEDKVVLYVLKAFEKREKYELGVEQMKRLGESVLLDTVDEHWKDHLRELDLLREGISYRAYAQKDPLIEYKKESFSLFQDMIESIQDQITERIFTRKILDKKVYDKLMDYIQSNDATITFGKRKAKDKAVSEKKGNTQMATSAAPSSAKVGRNEPCPCGSGKKYKNCCGKHA